MVNELKVLSSDTRLKILKELKDRPTTVSFLSKTLKKHVTTVSEHIEKLEHAGLVERQQRNGGKFVFYNLTNRGKRIIEPTLDIKLMLSGAILTAIIIFSIGLLYINQSRMFASVPASAPLEKTVGSAQNYVKPFNIYAFLLFLIPVFIWIFVLGIIIGRKFIKKSIPEY
jgi:DNA-binding transcriptional ArsR family regulator